MGWMVDRDEILQGSEVDDHVVLMVIVRFEHGGQGVGHAAFLRQAGKGSGRWRHDAGSKANELSSPTRQASSRCRMAASSMEVPMNTISWRLSPKAVLLGPAKVEASGRQH